MKKSRIPAEHWLRTRPIAHRGLHVGGIAENSLSAYRHAIEKDFPIEIDVHPTKDGALAVFHDDDLERVCGVKGKVSDFTAEELGKMKLSGTEDCIPMLPEVLAEVDGKVPLLIEIKNHADIGAPEETLCDLLRAYKGEFAVQSFNPLILEKIRELAPEFLRGQLACRKYQGLPRVQAWILRTLKSRFLSEPDFVSYDVAGLPYRYVTSKKYTLLCWTVTDDSSAQKAKALGANIIFENYLPKN